MATSENNKLIDLLSKAISDNIQKDVEKEFDNKIKELEKTKNEIVAGVLLNVMKMVDIEQFGEKIIFTIREIKRV